MFSPVLCGSSSGTIVQPASEKRQSHVQEGTSLARRMKGIWSNSPQKRRRRVVSMNSFSDTSGSQGLVFGKPLEELVQKGTEVPHFVRKVVEFIESTGLDEQGIYRVNGNVKLMENLKATFDKVGDANLSKEYDVATVGGLLKQFLRELPQPLIPDELLEKFVDIQKAHSGLIDSECILKLKKLLERLPHSNYLMLRYLMKHLLKVSKHAELNKMTPVSLSIVFGPNIFRCGEGIEGLRKQGYTNSIVYKMIQNCDEIFYVSEHQCTPDSMADVKHSEKSIDEAVKGSNGTIPAETTSHRTTESQTSGTTGNRAASFHSFISLPEVSNTRKNDPAFQRQYAKRKLNYQGRNSSSTTNEKTLQQCCGLKDNSNYHSVIEDSIGNFLFLTHNPIFQESSGNQKCRDEVDGSLDVTRLNPLQDNDQSFTTECGVSVLSAKSSYQPAVLSTDYHSSASVENTLSVLQTVLANRRKKEGRPNEVEFMTRAQVMEEKLALQKALLQFEKMHGRPRSRSERCVMKPLYERYRLVKKTLSTEMVQWEAFKTTDIDCTVNTLPTVTFTHSAFSSSLPMSFDTKTFPSVICEPLDIKKASLSQLHEQHALLNNAKTKLRKKLKRFAQEFKTLHGRPMTKEDRTPLHQQYKVTKHNLRILDTHLEAQPK